MLHTVSVTCKKSTERIFFVEGDSKDSNPWDESKPHQHPVKSLNKLKVLQNKYNYETN